MNSSFLVLFTLLFSITGCLQVDIKSVTVVPPLDEIENQCKIGKMGGVEISCERLLGANGAATEGRLFLPEVTVPSEGIICEDGKCFKRIPGLPATSTPMLNEDALIVIIEPATYEKNIIVSEDTAFRDLYQALTSSNDSRFAAIAEAVKPHVRIVMRNIFRAAIEQTIASHPKKKYGRIYFVASEIEQKKLFLQTIDKATHLHRKVDILAVLHGTNGRWEMDMNFSPSGKLNSKELILFGEALGDVRRNKVRYIFSTACWNAKESNSNPSMAEGMVVAFPSARTYGSVGINFFPLHRDLISFDRFYRDDSPDDELRFSAAVAWGARAMERNLVTGLPRYEVNMPNITVRGCGKKWGIRKCQTDTLKVGGYPATSTQLQASYPFIFKGSKVGGGKITIDKIEGITLSYIPMWRWPFVTTDYDLPEFRADPSLLARTLAPPVTPNMLTQYGYEREKAVQSIKRGEVSEVAAPDLLPANLLPAPPSRTECKMNDKVLREGETVTVGEKTFACKLGAMVAQSNVGD